MMRENSSIDKVTFSEIILFDYKFNFCGQMMLRNRSDRITLIAWIIDETDMSMTVMSRGGKRVKLFRSMRRPSSPQASFGKCGKHHKHALRERLHHQHNILSIIQ